MILIRISYSLAPILLFMPTTTITSVRKPTSDTLCSSLSVTCSRNFVRSCRRMSITVLVSCSIASSYRLRLV